MASYLFTRQRAQRAPTDGLCNFTAPLTPTSSSGLMFYVKTLPALSRTGAEIPFRRLTLLCSRGQRFSGPGAPPRPEQRDDARRRAAALHDSARSQCPRQPGRGVTHSTGAAANELSVDFDQTREAYKSKDSIELLRSLVVFKLCSYDFLVEKNKEVMKR